MDSKARIIAFAGSKQSGKSTCLKFLHGLQLKMYGVVNDFSITDTGDLIVNLRVEDDKGKVSVQDVILDVYSEDPEFVEWASSMMYPFVKRYSFAAPLKSMASTLFGIPEECCNGTDEQKNQIQEHLLWENMPGMELKIDHQLQETGPMTAREFLQYFGTDIMRSIKDSVWVDLCINSILYNPPLMAVIDDCRFPNEVEAVQKAGGIVVGLTRSPHKDEHASETSIRKSWDSLDYVLDNANMNIRETCDAVATCLVEAGWVEKVGDK